MAPRALPRTCGVRLDRTARCAFFIVRLILALESFIYWGKQKVKDAKENRLSDARAVGRARHIQSFVARRYGRTLRNAIKTPPFLSPGALGVSCGWSSDHPSCRPPALPATRTSSHTLA
eukprot:5026946-Prymnesium_polylepis.1